MAKGVEGKEREGRRVIEAEEGGDAKGLGGVGLGGKSPSLNFSERRHPSLGAGKWHWMYGEGGGKGHGHGHEYG